MMDVELFGMDCGNCNNLAILFLSGFIKQIDTKKISQRYAYEGDSDWEEHRAFPVWGTCGVMQRRKR